MKHGQSVVDGKFGGPLTAETPASTKDKENNKDTSLKRSNTATSSRGLRRSLSQTQTKLQKVRVEESVKATKEKESKEREVKDKESRHRSSDKGSGASTPKEESIRSKERDDKHRKSRAEKREKEETVSGQKDEKKKSGGLKGMFRKLFS